MDNFIDRTTSEGRFDFSEWVRAYGKYLDEQVRGRCCSGALGDAHLQLGC